MQLLIRRSQRDTGVLSKSVLFCLDARAQLDPAEQTDLTRYRLGNQVIYNSAAAKKHIDAGANNMDGGMVGSLKALGSFAIASMQLNITIDNLQRGQHIECKSLEELLGAEEAIMTACENLQGFLQVAATFDGRETIIDFSSGKAQALTSAPQIAYSPPPPSPPAIPEHLLSAPLASYPPPPLALQQAPAPPPPAPQPGYTAPQPPQHAHQEHEQEPAAVTENYRLIFLVAAAGVVGLLLIFLLR